MLCQNKRIQPPNTNGNQFPVELTDWVPGPDREEMARIVPPGSKKATATWVRNLLETFDLHVGEPGKKQWVRVFPVPAHRHTLMSGPIPTSVAPNHRVAAWWGEPSPDNQEAGSLVCTLHIGVVRDENAPAPVTGDGLDHKPESDLLTIAGMEGAKGVKKGQLPTEIIERIRANRIQKAKSKPGDVPASPVPV